MVSTSTLSEGRVPRGPWANAPGQVERRLEGQRAAAVLWPKVRERCRWIDRFPFVRAVAVSGSLSKGVHFPGDDVDFFLVTSAGRVWTCRLLLMLFKRVALLGSRRLFCINYLVDESALQIPDRNRFTAAEVTWLVPMLGHQTMSEFFRANAWVEELMPRWTDGFADRRSRPSLKTGIEKEPQGHSAEQDSKNHAWPKRVLERTLSGLLGAWVERTSRVLIKRRNARRYATSLTQQQYAQAMRGERAVSKHHPSNQQGRILDRFEQRWAQIDEAFTAHCSGKDQEPCI